jgi:hypothetical protein
MSTFAELEHLVTIITERFDLDNISILRKAENDFIEKTNCTEEFYNVNTNTLNLADEEDLDSGVLSDLYSLPSGFVREYRVEWDGIQLHKHHKGAISRIYNATNEIRTGTPDSYVIEDEQLRLLPKPTSHSYLNIWYCKYNTDGSSASPIIATREHEKIVNYVIAKVFEILNEENRAQYYWEKYKKDLIATYNKYKNQRFAQDRIYDGTIDREFQSLQNRIPIVTEP